MAKRELKCECTSSKNNDKCGEINPDLKERVDRIAKREGFSNYNLLVKNIKADGNNYMSLLSDITIHDPVTDKELNLFVKSILPSANELKLMSLPDAFCIEVLAYLELSNILEKLQADANIPLDERYKFVKCYKETTTENIIMENMTKKGFITWNRFQTVSLEYAEKAIKLLAKFHSLGFALEDKNPDFFKNSIMPLKCPLNFDEEYKKFYGKMFDNVLDYLEDNARSKLENKCDYLRNKGKKYITDRDTTLTMCYGDFRANNILVRIDEREITEMFPVDYQLMNYGSPLIDLIYFIFGATDTEFRRKHLKYLKNLYYDTLKQFLKYFDMDVQKYYPEEEYERLFKERLDFGLFTCIWYLQLNLAEADNAVDLSKSQFSDADFGKNDLAKVQYQQVIDEFIELGYL